MPSGEGEHHFPAKELGGENLVRYFAGLLFDQTIAMRFVHQGGSVQNTPLFAHAEQILQENERIEQHLRELGLYLYKPDGSVFMDYKNMRDKKFPQDGELTQWEDEHIKLTMSSEQAFDVCKKEVATWWDVK